MVRIIYLLIDHFNLKDGFLYNFIQIYVACRIEILNGNSSYRKMLIKETELFCGYVGIIEVIFLDATTSDKVI